MVTDPATLARPSRPDQPTVLLALDPETTAFAEDVVSALGGRCVRATSEDDVLRHASDADLAAIVLDARPSGGAALRCAQAVRALPRSRATPVVFVTGPPGTFPVDEAYALGAVDHLAAPLSRTVLQTKLALLLELRRRKEELRRARSAEEAAANAKFRFFFEQGSYFAGVMTLDGTVIEANRLCLDACGFTREDVIGKKFWDCGWWSPSPELREMVRAGSMRAAEGEHFRKVSPYFLADGSERVVDLILAPVTDDGGRVVFIAPTGTDITERFRSESTQRFLADLAAATQPLTHADAVIATTARMLGEFLGCDRCAYAEVDDDADHFDLTGDYNRGVPSIVGRYAFSEFGDEVLRLMRANRPYAIDDVEADPRAGADLSAYRRTQIRAIVCVPLHKDGRLAAAMAVHQSTPRRWLPDEVDLVQVVVARCWESIARTRALRALEDSEARFRQLADTIPNLAWMARPDGHIFWYNRRWYEYTGATPEEMEGWGWQRVHEPETLPHVLERWTRSIATGETFNMVFPLRGKDGVFRPFLTLVNPLTDDAGKVALWFGTNTEITEQKRTEDALARAAAAEKQRSSLLARVAEVSRSLHAVLSVDSVARILTEEARALVGAHRAWTSLVPGGDFGQPIEAMSTSDAYRAHGGADASWTSEVLEAQVRRTNRPVRLGAKEVARHPAWRAPGELDSRPPVSGWLAVPLMGHGGRNLGLLQLADKYAGDFTEEDEAIVVQLAAVASVGIENAWLYDSLREADKRKDEFLATLAHELRNPLAPMRTGLEILKLGGGDAARRARDMMERQLRQMVRLVDDLMDVSRVSRGKVELEKQRVPVRSVVDLAIETTLPVIQACGHDLSVSVPDEPLWVDADVTRLSQVLGNILNNAAKYTPRGGHIALSAERAGDAILLRVADDGLGMPAEMLPKVFDLFTQVGRTIDRAQGGLGIGLSLVRRLVEMHGGTVRAESAGLGAGSTFTVCLPLAPEPGAAGDATASRSAAGPVVQRRVLVVDDNVDAAESLAMLISLAGHETRTAHSGPDALAAAREFRPHVVFLDIGLPGLNGYDVATRMLADAAAPRPLLVAVTGWGADEDRRRSEQAGFAVHLTKPVDFSAVEGVLGMQR